MSTPKINIIKTVLIGIRRILRWFVSGEGALVTLTLTVIAAILSFLVQDAIQKQRYLELLELETRNNLITANVMMGSFNKQHGILYPPYPLFNIEVYNAGLQSGYITSIDTTSQAQIVEAYSRYVPANNKLITDYESVIERFTNQWEDCLVNSTLQIDSQHSCDQQKQLLDNTEKLYSPVIFQSYASVAKTLSSIKFNPTEQRLHPKNLESLILRAIMGKDSLKVLQ